MIHSIIEIRPNRTDGPRFGPGCVGGRSIEDGGSTQPACDRYAGCNSRREVGCVDDICWRHALNRFQSESSFNVIWGICGFFGGRVGAAVECAVDGAGQCASGGEAVQSAGDGADDECASNVMGESADATRAETRRIDPGRWIVKNKTA